MTPYPDQQDGSLLVESYTEAYSHEGLLTFWDIDIKIWRYQMPKDKAVKMVQTTLRLPQDLYKALNHLAVDEDETVRSLIQKAIETLLKSKGKKWNE